MKANSLLLALALTSSTTFGHSPKVQSPVRACQVRGTASGVWVVDCQEALAGVKTKSVVSTAKNRKRALESAAAFLDTGRMRGPK